jgi:hypothetical protein
MPESQYRARQVGAKTQEVINYDHNEALPGKPLHILIPGGLVALAALAVIIVIGLDRVAGSLLCGRRIPV